MEQWLGCRTCIKCARGGPAPRYGFVTSDKAHYGLVKHVPCGKFAGADGRLCTALISVSTSIAVTHFAYREPPSEGHPSRTGS